MDRDYLSAEQLYQDALTIDSDCASAHFGIGSIALSQNRLADALAALALACALEPEAPDFAFNYGHALSSAGDKIKALVEFQRVSKYCGNDPVFCAKLAAVFLQLDEPAASIQMLSRMTALLPRDQLVLAKAHGALNHWKEAVNVLQRLSDELPKEALVANELSIAAANYRDYDTAVAAFERFLRSVTPTANDYLRFADLLFIAQLPDRCEKALELAAEQGEERSEVYMLKAKLHRLKADYIGANLALDKVLEQMPNHGKAWAMRAELATHGDLPECISTLEKELETEGGLFRMNQRQALMFYALGAMQERVKNFQGAAEAFERANNIQHDLLVSSNSAYVPEKNQHDTDQLISQFNSQVMKLPGADSLQKSKSKQPIFIVGIPRSGTTLVERMLGQNTQVFSAGELPGMEFVATDFLHYQRSGKLPETQEISAEHWSMLRKSYLDKLPEISEPIFTDKLPHNFRNVGLILKLFPDARIIQMHRSLQDVCLSIFCHAFTESHNYATAWPSLAHFWSEAERLMSHWSSLQSERVLDLNYEDLVQKPDEIGKKLVEFCGFSWDPSYLEFHRSVNHSYTFSEIEVRQPITAGRVDRWRNYESAIPTLKNLSIS